MKLLDVKNLSKHFGGLKAVNKVNFHIEQDEILGLIGPNGSGKSTTVNALTGIYPCTEGEVIFKEQKITDLPPHKVISLGISRTFQGTRIFGNLTAFENIARGRHCRHPHGAQPGRQRWPAGRRRYIRGVSRRR